RLDQFQTQHELARNFYDDFDFCPVQCTEDAIEHRERIQQRISPHSSPRTSPTMGGYSVSHKLTPPSKRAIPIINPANMAPVSV
ncbi:uncharacterized protein BYT42DRAFT_476666, partial [Radiomyces spectabilis]|uniref:uncharacterized protein n=1 Tax=Radiomyces spectabilis TaxID=64574 RepID=UPI00221FB5A7